jgi:hypothetical protein
MVPDSDDVADDVETNMEKKFRGEDGVSEKKTHRVLVSVRN